MMDVFSQVLPDTVFKAHDKKMSDLVNGINQALSMDDMKTAIKLKDRAYCTLLNHMLYINDALMVMLSNGCDVEKEIEQHKEAMIKVTQERYRFMEEYF